MMKWSSFLVSEWLGQLVSIIRVTLLFYPYRENDRGVTFGDYIGPKKITQKSSLSVK